eukprot:6124942-Pyramimonas_sp.AAC.1
MDFLRNPMGGRRNPMDILRHPQDVHRNRMDVRRSPMDVVSMVFTVVYVNLSHCHRHPLHHYAQISGTTFIIPPGPELYFPKGLLSRGLG